MRQSHVAGEAHGYVLRPLAATATHEAAALLLLSIRLPAAQEAKLA